MITVFQSGGADYVVNQLYNTTTLPPSPHVRVLGEDNNNNNLESEIPKTPKTSRHQHHKKELNMKVKLVVGKWYES